MDMGPALVFWGEDRARVVAAIAQETRFAAVEEHDEDNGTYNSLVKVDDNTYALAYTGNGEDGFIKTFTIPADGSSIELVAQWEHDTDQATWNSFTQVDSNTYALAYSGTTGDDGYIKTFGEMDLKLKRSIDHRFKAFIKMKKFFF